MILDAPPLTGRRTSPLIVALHTVTFRQARGWVPAAVGIGAAVGVRGGTPAVVGMVVGVTLLSLATATLTWWRFSYLDGPTSVVVTRGLLARSVRTVPNDRIRGVEVEAPPLHRLFGLVRVRIDAAAGAMRDREEELVVDGVTRAEGDRLRIGLLTRRPTLPADQPAPAVDDAEEQFARFDNRWLLYAPLVGSYLLLPLAAVGALFRLTDELPERWQPHLLDRDLFSLRVLVTVVVAGVVLLVVGAVVGATVVNWRFRLVRRGGSLVASRGLITRRHTQLEIDRIRGCTVAEGVGLRLVRAARVSALVTGLGDAARRGQLLPLGPREEAVALSARLLPDPGPLTRHPVAARRRRLVRATAPGAGVLLAGAVLGPVLGWWWVPVLGVVLVAAGAGLGLGRYAALGHATGPASFGVRAGWLTRETAVLQRRAVVGWQVRQSLFQRWNGLATVLACVGAGSGGYAAVDMAADDVAGFTAAASDGTWASTFTAPRAPSR